MRKWITLMILSVAALCGAIQGSPAQPPSTSEGVSSLTPETQVMIVNNLQDGLTVTLECASGDDDLGIHVVADGQNFQFTFHPNIFGTTAFWCAFDWVHGQLKAAVYYDMRDRERCDHFCFWAVTIDSLNGYDGWDQKVDIRFPWKPPTN